VQIIHRFLLILLSLVPFYHQEVSGQVDENLYIYGYSQTIFYRQSRTYTIFENQPTVPTTITQKFKNSTFSLQQLNVFLNKPFDSRFNVFINLEFQASYSSQRQSGAFNLQEGWMNYNHSDWLNVKVGLLLPVFNNLHEIQNRLPLFPYLFRPVVYEVLFSGQVDFEDYLPERAYLQLSGFVPIGSLRLDYAGHVGNSETSYLSTDEPGSGTSTGGTGGAAINLFRGEDLTIFKAYGGRVGVRTANERFKFGGSVTYDKDNRNTTTTKTISRLPGFVVPILGDVPRVRLGADLSFQVGRVAFEGEYIKVLHDVNYPLLPDLSLDKQFYYVNLLYNLTDRLFGYVGYGSITNETFEAVVPDSPDAAGILPYTVGGGYKINDALGVKLQYIYGPFGENPYLEVKTHWLFSGLSLVF
jgi:hypothetical protein